MSLGIVIKGPEGLVLAADSRVTLASKTPQGQIFVNYDNATKLMSFSKPNMSVGVVTYGQAIIGTSLRTAHSFLPEFEPKIDKTRLSVLDFTEELKKFYLEQWEKAGIPNYQGPPMIFVVGGFNKEEHFGRVYLFEIPNNSDIHEQNAGPNDFGITWGGQKEIVDRIILGFDERVIAIANDCLHLDENQRNLLATNLQSNLKLPFPLQMLPLQDCVDLAIFVIRTTRDAQRLSVGIRGVGGPIDVATITRQDGFKFIQRKYIKGEGGIEYAPTNKS